MALSIFPAGGKKMSDYMILSMVKPASTASAYFELTVPEGRLAGIVGLEESGGNGGFYTFSSIGVSEDSKTIIYSEGQNGGASAVAPTKTMKCLYIPKGSKWNNFEIRTAIIPAASQNSAGSSASVELIADKGIIGGIYSISDSGGGGGFFARDTLERQTATKMVYRTTRNGGGSATPTRTIRYIILTEG